MKEKVIGFRITPQQEMQIEGLKERGFGSTSDILRTALDRMWQTEKDNDAIMDDHRSALVNAFAALEIGYDEDIYKYPIPILENLLTELQKLLEDGKLSIETGGIEAVQEIYERVVYPFV